MSAKNLDTHNRWRNKTVAFRVSPEENKQIDAAVRLSGLTKQDYITRRLLDRAVVVQGNPRVYKALRDQLAAGRQAYIVCPLVEESENADGLMAVKSHARELSRKVFAGFTVGLTYGTQPAAEKQAALADFEARGGDVKAQLAYEESTKDAPPASYVLQETDEDGDAEISLVF